MSKELGRKALFGTLTTGLGSLGGFAVRFVVNAIIARQVGAIDLGDFTMAVAEAELIGLLGSFSFPQALVQLEDRYEKLPGTVLVMSVALALVLFLVALAAWPFVSAAHGELVGECFLAMAASRIVTNTSASFLSGEVRRFHYHRAAMLQFLSVAFGSLLALALAYVAPGPFVFVVRDVAPPALVALGYGAWALARDRASLFGFDRVAAKAVWQLGRSLFLTRLVEVVYSRVDQLVVGVVAGRESLGFYQQARYLAGLPAAAMSPVIHGVGLRTFAALSDDPRRQRRIFDLTQLVITRTMLVAAIGTAVGGDLIVRVVLGPNWGPVGPLLQWASLLILLTPLVSNVQTVMIALRRFRPLVVGQLLSAGVLAGACLGLGVYLDALGAVLGGTIALSTFLGLLVRYLPEHLAIDARNYLVTLALGAGAIAVGLGVRAALPAAVGRVPSALAGTAAALVAYAVTTWLLEGRMLREELRYVRSVVRRGPEPAAVEAPPEGEG